MKSPIRALLVDANGFGWRVVAADTVLRGVLRLSPSRVSPQIMRLPGLRRALKDHYASLGYVADWREAFVEHPDLLVDVCNSCNLVDFYGHLRNIREYDLIILLHSATGDSMEVLNRTLRFFDRRRAPIMMFLGNEYDLMREKISFIRQAGVEFVCTQLPERAAKWVYAECSDAQLLMAPHALNPRLYHPQENAKRTVDVGFVGALYHNQIGDMERTRLIEYFEQKRGRAVGLNCDIRYTNLPRTQWSAFLNSCKAIVGAESGTYYLDREGLAVRKAIRYVRENPQAKFEDVFEKCFTQLPEHTDGKAISSRHFEPIGTKTCQILIEGDYNGILRADEHYVSVKKDLSNIDAAIDRFCDEKHRAGVVDRAYDHIMAHHTYARRVDSLLQQTRVAA
jgi:hypothetical protein